MTRLLLALAFCISSIALAVAQQKESPAATLRLRVELVMVPAVVTQNGKPVKGLTAKDFILLHNDKPQKVAVFEEIEAVHAKAEQPALPPRTVQNYATADSHQDVVILVLDYLNADSSTSARIRRHLREMAQVFAETGTPVTVLVLSYTGLVQVHSFTSDPENLVKAVEQWSSNVVINDEKTLPAVPDWASPLVPTESVQTAASLRRFAVLPKKAPKSAVPVQAREIDKPATTRRAVAQIIGAFGGIPGRKKLIWMSARVSDYLLPDASFGLYPIITYPVKWVPISTTSLMGQALVRFSANNAEDNLCWYPSWIWTSVGVWRAGCSDVPSNCVQQALEDAAHHYLLGFYLQADSKPGWHKLKVKVNRPRTTVRARNGFLVSQRRASTKSADIEKGAQESAAWEDDAFSVALASPLGYTSVPLRLYWSAVSAQGDEIQVELVLTSPLGGIALRPEDMSFDVDYLAYIKPVGATEGQAIPVTLRARLSPEQQTSLATDGFLFRKQVTLTPGRYEVRVLLRDNVRQKMGSISATIDLTSIRAAVSGKTTR